MQILKKSESSNVPLFYMRILFFFFQIYFNTHVDVKRNRNRKYKEKRENEFVSLELILPQFLPFDPKAPFAFVFIQVFFLSISNN